MWSFVLLFAEAILSREGIVSPIENMKFHHNLFTSVLFIYSQHCYLPDLSPGLQLPFLCWISEIVRHQSCSQNTDSIMSNR